MESLEAASSDKPVTPSHTTKEPTTFRRKSQRVLDHSVKSDVGTGGKTRRSTSSQSSRRKKPKPTIKGPDAYAHLNPLQDYLSPGLDVVFCGINPGYLSAVQGYHFANPTNHFWRCLHRSGMTSVLLPPSDDYSLPERFNLGLTDLVARPSTEAGELTKEEMTASVPSLFDKLARHRPRFLCFVGVVVWKIIQRAILNRSDKQSTRTKKGKKKQKTEMGLQPYKLVYATNDSDTIQEETLFFLVPSTSGRVVQYQLSDKIALFTDLNTLIGTVPLDIDTSEMESVHWGSCS